MTILQIPTSWQQLLHRRRLAYVRTFCDDEGKPHLEAQRVLRDLKRFCGINKGGIVVSPVSRTVDSHATTYRAGMRDVYLRIAKMLDLDETDLEDIDEHERSDDRGQ